MSSMLTPRRLRLYPLAVLAGVTIGFVVFISTSEGLRSARGGRIGGDFPAFYGAARIIRAGASPSLYDRDVQRRAQSDLLPDRPDGWIDFAYPPYVALAYVPFTFLGFTSAYVAHTLLMAGCCVGALAMLRPHLPRMSLYFAPAVAAAVTFYPLCRAILGGQNTALSLLCAAGAASALARRRDVTAGLWLGAWLFKPQLAMIAAGIIVLAGYPRVILGILVAAAVYYLLGVLIGGPAWPMWWWRDGVAPFAVADLIVDRGNGVSLRELVSDIGLASLTAPVLLLTIVIVVLSVWRTTAHPIAVAGMAAAAAVLMAPHALYYDGGLAVLGLAVAGDASGRRILPALIGVWMLAAAQVFRSSLPFPPVTLVLAISFFLAARAARFSGDARNHS